MIYRRSHWTDKLIEAVKYQCGNSINMMDLPEDIYSIICSFEDWLAESAFKALVARTGTCPCDDEIFLCPEHDRDLWLADIAKGVFY